MLDIKFIRENKDVVKSAIKNKNRQEVDLDLIIKLYEERVAGRSSLDEINRKRNEASKNRDVDVGKKLKEESLGLEAKIKETEEALKQLLIKIPNIPSPDTPIGRDASGNKVIRTFGEKPKFDFKPKPHWQLGEELDVIDNERAAKVAGARFTYLKRDLALLQFALISYAFGILTNQEKISEIIDKAGLDIKKNPFIAVVPPVFAKPEIMSAMARLDPPEDKYYIESDNLYLVGSAEHTLGPMHAGELLLESEMPIRYVGYSTAFRREAGTYGKDTRGILRVHQFDKVEIESFCLPENSYKEQDLMVACQEYLMQNLGLHYQVISICTGDMGFPDHRQIDIETWMPGQDSFKETHSADLIGGFQPRRLNTKVKNKEGKSEYVHMNDATVFAIGRTLIAIMENFQQSDGSILIPEVLRPYVGGKEKIEKRN